MATPSKSVQFHSVDSVVQMYENMKIPAFGIKQNSALNYKYEGEDLELGAAQLRSFLDMLEDSQSAAIYTLALYEDADKIRESTPVDLSWNFRFRDNVAGFAGLGEHYAGGFGQLLGEVRELKKQVTALQTKEEPQGSLGMIGEIMEIEALQPLLGAIGTRIADWVMGAGKPAAAEAADVARISGIPGVSDAPGMAAPWRQDLVLCDALDRLSMRVRDLPAIMKRLADMADEKPGKFNVYLSMIRKM